eukprot:CAMPEP_0202057944 /NCGR_PEP_ID=MMETSP0963-20130614/30182_1 /ASSEMBLY_ACC=CAM_ASM_000494 /TAXON_ID=4773 /ORGANISM="Schizochytrium aggregatum, Strain ATCC28209" /LENGTH=80 /DNA_ID=CAMNT_0048623867 /DNA_START=151 /DNA_END=389 /DNA_ORIENTATION=+
MAATNDRAEFDTQTHCILGRVSQDARRPSVTSAALPKTRLGARVATFVTSQSLCVQRSAIRSMNATRSRKLPRCSATSAR